MSRVVKRAEARRDLVGCYIYIGRDRPEAADRFLAEAESTFQRLADHPGTGQLCGFPGPAYATVRQSRISRFKNFLVYYQPIDDGIEVLRVVHGARDQSTILEPDEDG